MATAIAATPTESPVLEMNSSVIDPADSNTVDSVLQKKNMVLFLLSNAAAAQQQQQAALALHQQKGADGKISILEYETVKDDTLEVIGNNGTSSMVVSETKCEIKLTAASNLFSNIITWMKYSRFDRRKRRREDFNEIVERSYRMHRKQYPMLDDKEMREVFQMVKDKLILTSMRGFQFAGLAVEKNHARIYNCCFMHVSHPRVFDETMFLLLGGTGVGFSVQVQHVAKLPVIRQPLNHEIVREVHRENVGKDVVETIIETAIKKTKIFVVPDTLEGWALSIRALFDTYMPEDGKPKYEIKFNYDLIRAAGSELVTAGGKAPGPKPLMECHNKLLEILNSVPDGTKLRPIQCHDIQCLIAESVLSGGIRRSSLISLFSHYDKEMLTAKAAGFDKLAPWRYAANNSVVLHRKEVDMATFSQVWEVLQLSGKGEPGIFWTNDYDKGTNPCGEVGLNDCQFCNLTEINGSTVENQEDFNKRARAAAYLGTLQAGYTNFHYLRPKWREITEKEALLGVSCTGIASKVIMTLDFEQAAKEAVKENERVAGLIGINKAARVTCVKPAGTTSLVLGSPSGIHPWHDKTFYRRVRVNKKEAIYPVLMQHVPGLMEDSYYRNEKGEKVYSETTAVLTTALKAPEGAITRKDENCIDFLKRVNHVYTKWVLPGHNYGENTHNVSATVSIEKGMWWTAGIWMWEHREQCGGMAIFPHEDPDYEQLPLESCSEEEYLKIFNQMKNIDLKSIKEDEDGTNFLTSGAACLGGSCELVH